MAPSELYGQYNPDLQGVLDGRCRSIAILSDASGVPTLKDVADAYGTDDAAVEWIKIQLEKVNTFVNVKEKLNLRQLYDVSVQILNCYDYLNVLEFCLFCGRLRHGIYEEFYGCVDPMKILASLDRFVADRSSDLRRKREQQLKDEADQQPNTGGYDIADAFEKSPESYPTLQRILGKKSKMKEKSDESPRPG